MILSHLKISLRTLLRNKTYTAVNLVGLSIGIAAALLIFRIVRYELSFNTSFPNAERIVRVVSMQTGEEGEVPSVCIPVPAMEIMRSTVTQFQSMARVKELWCTITVPSEDNALPQRKFNFDDGRLAFFAEPQFAEIFSLHWMAGDSVSALREPHSVVLTKTWAEKCFDTWQAAIGKTILIDHQIPLKVTGVIQDLPVNTDFPLNFLVSYETLKSHRDYFYYDDEHWGNCSSNNQVYALLHEDARVEVTNEQLKQVGAKEYSEATGNQRTYHLIQPLKELHYDPGYPNSGSHLTEKSRLNVLSVIGILILVMACFNFINLATAQGSLHAREVGVRKTLGSGRSQLIGRFMSETALLSVTATLAGCAIAMAASPLLKFVSHVPDTYHTFDQPQVVVFLAILCILVTLLAGLYPSFALSSFQPVKALKGTSSFAGGAGLRKSLVVLQFIIAQALIIGAIVTILQLEFINNKDLGFQKDLVYTFSFNTDSMTLARQKGLKLRMLQIPGVVSVSLNSDQPMSGNTWTSNFRYADRAEDEKYGINQKFTDEDYAKTYGISLLAGRWLNPSDTVRECVVNHTVVKKLGLTSPEEIIGQKLFVNLRWIEVVGVTTDLHQHSLRYAHDPLMFSTRKEYYWEAGIKVQPDQIPATIAAIRKAYDEVLPEQVFSGRFYDERIEELYADDQRLSATCKAFGFLAILISCLGLFGLATHAAAQRVKEIGIRKVLGASVAGILSLLSKDFIRLVIIAFIVASPLAWYLMHKWLNNFQYRTEIPWVAFVVTGGLAIIVAFGTVSLQSLKAALGNPVKSLRSE